MTAPAERASADNGRPDVPDAALVAARAADAKLGQDTVVLAMGDLLGVTDAFVVTSGANTRQVRTIVDEVERQVKQSVGRSPRATEGLRDLTWVLMDYGDFLVHVFQDEARAYYDLERLWGNAPRLSVKTECPTAPPGTEHPGRGSGSRGGSRAASGGSCRVWSGPGWRTARRWRSAPRRRSPPGPPRARPSSQATAEPPGSEGGGEDELGHRLDLRWPHELAEAAPDVHRGHAPRDRRVDHRGLRQRRLQPCFGLGVGGPGHERPEHGLEVGETDGHVPSHGLTGLADAYAGALFERPWRQSRHAAAVGQIDDVRGIGRRADDPCRARGAGRLRLP